MFLSEKEGRGRFLKKAPQKLFRVWPRMVKRARFKFTKVFWFWRPDDGAAKPRSLNRAASKGSKKNYFLFYKNREV